MKLYFKFHPGIAFKKIIQEQLEKLNMHYVFLGLSEIEVDESVLDSGLNDISTVLGEYGIELIENHKSILVQKIKDTITEMVFLEEKPPVSNSEYISDKLKKNYVYLTSIFTEVTYTTIENYIILQKTERAKQLIRANDLSMTDIAYVLNYSSVAHLSNQFKRVTGITPSTFQRILKRRQKMELSE
jgi:AraC-like DNA-binding protein